MKWLKLYGSIEKDDLNVYLYGERTELKQLEQKVIIQIPPVRFGLNYCFLLENPEEEKLIGIDGLKEFEDVEVPQETYLALTKSIGGKDIKIKSQNWATLKMTISHKFKK